MYTGEKSMAGSSVLTLRLDPKLKAQLDRLSKATNRSRSFVAAEAIREYVHLNHWQIEETRKALDEADRGEFANDKDARRTLKKWTRHGR
jgi:RHH-type transcriptional regulator, rel operon repressor / antitoxin RelB